MGLKGKKSDISLVLCGEAGQGIQTVEQILVKVFKLAGYHVFASKEYMSRVRGGENSTQIRISSHRVAAYLQRTDILVALSPGALQHMRSRISTDTIILGDKTHLNDDNCIKLPLIELAKEIGGPIYSNVIAAGVVAQILGVPKEIFQEVLKAMFLRKGEIILNNDLKAGKQGYELGEQLIKDLDIYFKIIPDSGVKDELLLNGSEAVGLGVLAAGLGFMSSYPMTPSSPLQAFIASQARNMGLIFEQAEDEIAALNLALGASYAGARSMVATSASGFALMVEAVGLAGMIETPVVINLAMRPGPAVGLPTRTAQEDLDLALYGSPGEFARAIFAPGRLDDAYIISQQAFNLADKYQIPVFILTDQYFADFYHNLPSEWLEDVKAANYIVKTQLDYKRYSLTKDGISPRGVPGFGDGLVVVDSDEHDEEGHITEDLDIRKKMVEKRYYKLDKMKDEVLEPRMEGAQDYRVLMIGWGSSYGPLKEALDLHVGHDVALLHYQQVYPLHRKTKDYLDKADLVLCFENNIKGQFGQLIKLETGLEVESVLKYDGMPFTVEEISSKLEEV